MSDHNLELALRLKTDLEAGRREVSALSEDIESVGQASATTSQQLNQIGESAAAQADRIRLMVEASLQQQAAADALAASTDRVASATDNANASWNETAAAQNAAMNAYHNAERAAEQKAQADLQAAEAAKQAGASVEQEAQELQQLLGKIDPVVRKLDELDEMERQLRQSRASGKIDLDTFDTFNAKLTEQRQRLGGTTDAMRVAGITAGQYQQAVRQLPMQITDITTSLASGMPIWLVAIQQGGQIKDSFGGIGNAAKALVASINPLSLAIGVAVAGVAALATAWYQGSREGQRYRENIILTGNAAGVSSNQLADMAREIDGIQGTQRQAAAALAELTKTGKFTAAQMRDIGIAAVAMQNATGKAITETVAEFVKLADAPAEASAALNREFNYLTAEIYEQIAALEEQGDEYGAAELALNTYADAMEKRASELEGNLGLVEEAWKAIKKGAAEAWDEMLAVGRDKTPQQQLEDLGTFDTGPMKASALIAPMFTMPAAIGKSISDYIQQPEDDEATRARLQAEIDAEAAAAKAEGDQRRLQQESIAAQQELAKLREQSLDRVAQKEKAIADYRANVEKIRAANPDSELIGEDRIAQDLAAIEKRYEEKVRAPRQPRERVDRELQAQQNYVAQLERQAATLELTSAEVRQYELAEKGLTGALLERAQAAAALINATEQQRQADANARANTALEADYLRSIGQSADAAMLEVNARFSQMKVEFEKAGNLAGLAFIDQLIPVEHARIRLQEVQDAIDEAFAAQQRAEQSIGAQVSAGLITEMEGRSRLVDLHRETAAAVESYLPDLREMAALPGPMGEQAAAALELVETKLLLLRETTNELKNALRDGLQGGIEQSLLGLVNGTMSLREAITSLVQSVADSLTKLAAQKLAETATDSIMGLFSSGGGGGDSATATAITTASLSGAQAMGTAISMAGLQAAQAMGTAIATGSAGASTGNAVSGIAGAAGSTGGSGGMGGAGGWIGMIANIAGMFFADGGHILGPGSTTSDSVPILASNYEFITRAAVVQQPGALGFLEDFNARGMAALNDWANVPRHSTGGLAGYPAPALPSPSMPSTGRLEEPAKNMATTVKNAVNLHVYDDPQRIADSAFRSAAGEEAFVMMLSRDPAKYRSILNVNG